MEDRELLDRARAARDHAHAPYSGFAVGAALETADGRVFTGVNVENASIGLSVCAERNAVAAAVAAGARDFRTLAIVTDAPEPTMPCGVCRQVLWEFGEDLRVLVGTVDGHVAETTLRELYPKPFTSYETTVNDH
ncbi:MAG: cytidine deaminase [Candidatus Eisenbacteria bacterium]|nr:cytidine deaminase [Candidatus Eisenbacteria bacterium]